MSATHQDMTNQSFSPAPHILIVDDERTTRLALTEVFGQSGFQTNSAATGQEALQKLQNQAFDAVILDMHLSDAVTGLDILGVAQEIAPDTAFIVLTGYATTESAIMALRSGAYDYLQKPVSLQLIIETAQLALAKRAERLREKDAMRLLRQAFTTLSDEAPPAPKLKPEINRRDVPTAVVTSLYTVGDITLDDQRQRVTCAHQELTLTPIEYKLLHYLVQHPHVVFSYTALAEISHEMPDLDESEARALLRTHIYRLRRKLEHKKKTPLQTVRGRGVVLQDE